MNDGINNQDFRAARVVPQPERYNYAPHQRAVDLERQKLHEENAKLASEVLRLRSTVRDRERMIWFAIAAWLVLLAMVLLNR